MSKIADLVYEILKKEFPFNTIEKEYYINFNNTRLFFDFYIKDLAVCVECQGKQHSEFVKHFHGDKEKFYGQKRRDNLKVKYCLDNGLILVYLYDQEDKITSELILNRIYEAMND